MKSFLWGFFLCFVVFSLSVCGQKKVDRSLYTAIDPFDYKLNEKKAEDGSVRKFKSVVQFKFKYDKGLSFASLDQATKLNLTVTGRIPAPAADKIATIYYTATAIKKGIDTLVLDEIDYSNTAEEGIELVKLAAVPSGINKASYTEIEPFDYKIEAENANLDDERKYKSTMLFLTQDGLTFYFVSEEADDEEGTVLTLRASQRFSPLTPGQRVVVYYTAKKGIVDILSLDDIEL